MLTQQPPGQRWSVILNYYTGLIFLLTALALYFVPNLVCSIIGMSYPSASTNEMGLFRICGVFYFVIGYFYVCMTHSVQAAEFVKASVFDRLIAAALAAYLVYLGQLEWQVLLFAAVDTISAVLTYNALEEEANTTGRD